MKVKSYSKKMFRRIWVTFLALVLCFNTVIPVYASENTQIASDGSNVIEGLRIFETDFETGSPSFTFINNSVSTIQKVQDDAEHGTVVELNRTAATKDFYIHYKPVNAETTDTSIVYEFDVKLLDANTQVQVALAGNGLFSYGAKILNCGLQSRNNFAWTDSLETLEVAKWYTISMVYDYATKTRSIYLDGELAGTGGYAFESNYTNTADAEVQLRIYCPAADDASHFMVDNVRVYEGTKPYEGELVEKSEDDVVIEIDPSKSIFNDLDLNTDRFDEMLDGYVALHTRSGMVYNEGTKVKLSTKPVESADGFSVVLDEISAALGIICQVENNQTVVNGKTVTVWEQDGKQWVDAEEFLSIYGIVSIDTNDTVKSNGMMIAGESAFEWPSSDYDRASVFLGRSDLQHLNDYLFFERPSQAKIAAAYAESSLKGVHPRIQATAADFARLKTEVQTDPQKKIWYEQVIAQADYLVDVNRDPVKYELPDGIRLQTVSKDVSRKMYVLGMAYQLTGEEKYAERAWLDLKAVSEFKDWNPSHALDTGVMSTAVAIGYDWMYDAFTEEQRKTIEEGVYKNCFVDVCESYESINGIMGSNPISLINWNIVLNGGFAMSALAFMDVYPEVASYITSITIRGADRVMVEYGKDGAWREGPGYWGTTTGYVAKMFTTLEPIFGTCFGLDLCEGLEATANYAINLQSDVGQFAYGDGGAKGYIPAMYWLSNKYCDENVTATVLELGKGKASDSEDLVLSLLWYDTDIQANSIERDLDAVYEDEGVITMRDKWTDGVTTFVGIHGGVNQRSHGQIDSGTFVYDYAGVRWTKELGNTPYDTTVTAQYGVDGGRWLLYRSLAEAHNLLVINPDNTPGQKVEARAEVELVASKPKGSIAKVDLTDNYSANVSSAIRGFFFTDDRTSLVVRDEITLTKENSTVYWFMQTDAEVAIADDGKSAMLTQDGKQVKLEYVTSGNGTAELLVTPSTRALLNSQSPIDAPVSSNTGTYDLEDANVNRIAIKLTDASQDATITVKLTPVGVNSTPIDDYNKSIATWSVPDGEVAEKPEIQSVVIDGREIEFNDANKATFLCVEGKYDAVPVPTVTVDETNFTYEITNAETTDSGVTTILVKDKTNAEVYTSYTVVFEEIPVVVVPEGFTGTALQVIAAEASEEPEGVSNGFVAWKTVDNDTESRWTSQGMGQWILLELEKESTVDSMIILFKNGHLRSTYFSVDVSTDGENYQRVYTGESVGTALGSAEAYEKVDLQGVTAKYIRINCGGNSAQGRTEGWNNIGEIVFMGTVNVVPDDMGEVLVDGENYGGTLMEAITAATENTVIQLNKGVDLGETDISLTKGTLDLNGKTLTAKSLATFEGTSVIDSTGGGLLKVDSTQCVFSKTNGQMPVYNGAAEGYVFADIADKKDYEIVEEDDSTVFKLFFKPSFDTTINTLLANGSKDAHISVIIRLTWKGESYDLTYNNDMVKAVYGKDNMAFYINASGVEKFEGLIITPMVVSDDLKVEWSGTSFSDFTTTK